MTVVLITCQVSCLYLRLCLTPSSGLLLFRTTSRFFTRMSVTMASSTSEVSTEIKKTEKKCSQILEKIKQLEKQLMEARRDHTAAKHKLDELQSLETGNMLKRNMEQLKNSLETDWITRKFSWTDKIHKILLDTFGFKTFRPKQLAAINATLSKKDVLLVMPTGGGKSLVYQLPALVDKGMTIVISPLLSLIEDQIISLRKLGIKAASLNSTTAKEESKDIYNEIKDGTLKLLYVTPEWAAKSKRFMMYLKKAHESGNVSRVAVDEVHCCSMWGHDFRRDYEYLGVLKQTLKNVPFIGLTATATVTVLTDVQKTIGMRDCMIITAPFNRPNLFYSVVPKPVTKDQVLDCLEDLLKNTYRGQSGIIYTTTTSEANYLAENLKQRGVKAAPYHAQIEDNAVKKRIHRKWLQNEYQVVVATIAFGMGIDKPDVRFVIHASVPKSMEGLYQESGRAGRDGERADCTIFFSLNDYLKVVAMSQSLNEQKKALNVLEYCLDQLSCRRALLSAQFEESWSQSDCMQMCDHCKNKNSNEFIHYDLSQVCRDVHQIIEAQGDDEKVTLNKMLDGWLKTGPSKYRVASVQKPKINRQEAEVVLAYLILKQYLVLDNGFNNYSAISYLLPGIGCADNEKIEMGSFNKYRGLPQITTEPETKKPRLV